MQNMQNKRILIIGGTGTWGRALLEQLIKTQVSLIKIYSRNEYNMIALNQQFNDKRIQFMLGDIRDKARLLKACEDTDILFHLAAIKHVPICEEMPTEAILTNVLGTQNVIDCAILNKVKKVIYTSTDKAVSPHCTYGCTKLLGEKLILSANMQTIETKFLVFRSGNLLGSSGSVIPLFEQQIKQTDCVNLTDKQMNRFFIPVSKAAELLIETALQGEGGEIFLPRMDALSIHHIARYLLEKKGLDETHINIIGLRPGEKLDESMVTQDESKSLYQRNEELYALFGVKPRRLPTRSEYPYRSQDALLSYKDACIFLKTANV